MLPSEIQGSGLPLPYGRGPEHPCEQVSSCFRERASRLLKNTGNRLRTWPAQNRARASAISYRAGIGRERSHAGVFQRPAKVSPRLPCGEPAAILGSGIESNRFRTIPMTAARMCGNWRSCWERNRSLTRMVRQRGLRRDGPGVVCADVSKRTAESADLVPDAPPIRLGTIPMDLIPVRGSRRPCRKRNRSVRRAARQRLLRLSRGKPLTEVL